MLLNPIDYCIVTTNFRRAWTEYMYYIQPQILAANPSGKLQDNHIQLYFDINNHAFTLS